MKKKHRIWGAAALYAGIAGAAAYVMNKVAFYLATAKKLLNVQEGQYFDWKFGRIYYEVSGEGTPLLLIHELAEDGCGREWDCLRNVLAKHYQVYVVDLPGCGRSDKEKMLYTNYLYTAGINAFCEKVIGKKTDIVTSGISSTIAVMASHLSPGLYGKLVLINPESFRHMSKEVSLRERLLSKAMMLPLVGTSIYVIDYLVSFLKRKQADMLWQVSDPAGREANAEENIRREAAFLGGPAARFARASVIGRFTDIPFTFALKDLHAPICLIGGRETENITHTVEGYRYFYRNLQSYLLACGDMPHIEQMEETAQIIDEFLMEEAQ